MIIKDYGFVKLYRGLIDWRWYTSPNTMRLYIHCLMNAYYKETDRFDMKIPVGSFETSQGKLARELNLTKKQIRTALNNLKKTGEVTCRATRQCTIITVVGFVEDQNSVIDMDTIKAKKGHLKGSKVATNKEYNNVLIKEEEKWKI